MQALLLHAHIFLFVDLIRHFPQISAGTGLSASGNKLPAGFRLRYKTRPAKAGPGKHR